MGSNISHCKYYDNGICTVFGDGVVISCASVSNMTPEVCKNGNRSGNKKRRNNKRSKKNYS